MSRRLITQKLIAIAPCRVQRLPGIPSSHLGLQSLTGELDDFSFESYLGSPADSELTPPPLHAEMDARLAGNKSVNLRGHP